MLFQIEGAKINFNIADVPSQCGMKHVFGVTVRAKTTARIKEACNLFIGTLLTLSNAKMAKGHTKKFDGIEPIKFNEFLSTDDCAILQLVCHHSGGFMFSDRVYPSPIAGPTLLYLMTKDVYPSYWIPPTHYFRNPNYNNEHCLINFYLSATPNKKQLFSGLNVDNYIEDAFANAVESYY